MGRRQQDHYARRAKREGFAARSVYKLDEIDRRVRLLRPGMAVLDLGCAPGSWVQYEAKVVGPRGRVVGVDLQEVTLSLPPHVTLIQGDAFEVEASGLLSDGPFDVVTSDMAPATMGDRFTDHVRSMALCERAFEVACEVLRPGGSFVCKAFEGGELQALVQHMRPSFEGFRRIKPKGTRSESVELFLVGSGLREVP